LDETFQNYINRVTQLVLPANQQIQIQNIQQSPKFELGEAVYFPGYSVITPPEKEDSSNQDFYEQLTDLQKQLSEKLEGNLLIPLPRDSFHLTVADLIWDSNYRQAIKENPHFEEELRKQIEISFQQYQGTLTKKKVMVWQLLGIGIRPRAILACLVPQDRESHEPIIDLRRSIYQNRALFGLGIEQQYDFTAHITLGYFNEIPANLNRDRLIETLSQINDQLLEVQPQVFTIHRAELRKFDTMMSYYREPDWPVIVWED
jgi:hypothetical protein